MELGNTVRAVRAAGEAGSPARALVRLGAAVFADARVVGGCDISAITMSFDRMGRRVAKDNWCFVYDGYLQVADSAGSAYVWDPTESAATRPLAWTRGGDAAYYTHDGNKNVSEVVAYDGTLVAHYGYAPFGAVVLLSGVCPDCNFWRFSSEYMDDDIGILLYNFRDLNSVAGTWLTRDPTSEDVSINLYLFLNDNPIGNFDVLGLLADATHGTTKCKESESCDVLADKLGRVGKPLSDSISGIGRGQALP